MTTKDRDILEHILMRCNRVGEDIARFGNTFEIFVSDAAFRDSVSMNIYQIGELSHKLSNEFKDSTRQIIPWKQMYDMRCHFAHGYEKMDNVMIWKTAMEDIPPLKRFCEEQLSKE